MKIYPKRLLIATILAAAQIGTTANAIAQSSGALPPKDILDLIYAVAFENLAAFLLGAIVTLWFLEFRYRLVDRFEAIEDHLANNEKLLKRLVRHFEIKVSGDDV
ncbi:MAG: hypothetical protein KME10_24895 [Plectolyngbya sp. WJT66-NPBG17]|jgi:hypothetical protein|nr:hypothetical protein [Plectolyngbya sp. WJT66-NPBG17]